MIWCRLAGQSLRSLVVRDDRRADRRPFIDPLTVGVHHTYAAVAGVNISEHTQGTPIVAVDSVTAGKITDPFNIRYVVAGAVGIWAAHGLYANF